MFNGKNIDFDGSIAQIEKVSNLTGKQEYVLALENHQALLIKCSLRLQATQHGVS